jgi:hypothetical protein
MMTEITMQFCFYFWLACNYMPATCYNVYEVYVTGMSKSSKKGNGKVVPVHNKHHAMKMYRGVGVSSMHS